MHANPLGFVDGAHVGLLVDLARTVVDAERRRLLALLQSLDTVDLAVLEQLAVAEPPPQPSVSSCAPSVAGGETLVIGPPSLTSRYVLAADAEFSAAGTAIGLVGL